MTTVFKLTKRQYAQAAVEHGQVRLTHSSFFRVSDGIDDDRSDPVELTTSADLLDGEEAISSDDPRFRGMFVHML